MEIGDLSKKHLRMMSVTLNDPDEHFSSTASADLDSTSVVTPHDEVLDVEGDNSAVEPSGVLAVDDEDEGEAQSSNIIDAEDGEGADVGGGAKSGDGKNDATKARRNRKDRTDHWLWFTSKLPKGKKPSDAAVYLWWVCTKEGRQKEWEDEHNVYCKPCGKYINCSKAGNIYSHHTARHLSGPPCGAGTLHEHFASASSSSSSDPPKLSRQEHLDRESLAVLWSASLVNTNTLTKLISPSGSRIMRYIDSISDGTVGRRTTHGEALLHDFLMKQIKNTVGLLSIDEASMHADNRHRVMAVCYTPHNNSKDSICLGIIDYAEDGDDESDGLPPESMMTEPVDGLVQQMMASTIASMSSSSSSIASGSSSNSSSSSSSSKGLSSSSSSAVSFVESSSSSSSVAISPLGHFKATGASASSSASPSPDASSTSISAASSIISSSSAASPSLSPAQKFMKNATLPSEKAAAAIVQLCEKFGINIATQVVGLSADGAFFNYAVARILGLPLFICLAHIMYGIFKDVSKDFKLFEAITLGLSTLIRSGGGHARANALAAAGLPPSKLHCIKTRWNQLFNVMLFLLEVNENADGSKTSNLEKVVKVVLNDPAFQPKTSASAPPPAKKSKPSSFASSATSSSLPLASSSSSSLTSTLALLSASSSALDDDGDEEEVTVLYNGRRIVGGALLAIVRKACLSWHETELECQILKNICEKVPQIITESSSKTHEVKLDYLMTLTQDFRNDLVLHGGEGNQHPLLEHISEDPACRSVWTDQELTTLGESKYYDLVESAAARGLVAYDSHVPSVMVHLQRRLQYEVCNKPASPQLPLGEKQWKLGVVQKLLGCARSLYSQKARVELETYASSWDALSKELKELRGVAFWLQPEVQQAYPELSKLGCWYCCIPTSNVLVERLFGILRAKDSPLRRKMLVETLAREVCSENNRPYLEKMLAEYS